MTKSQAQIREFMLKAEQDVPGFPTTSNAQVRELRVRLIAEELLELASALGVTLSIIDKNIVVEDAGITEISLVEVYDALLDLKYVNEGGGVAFGLDLEPGFEEVHRSNMAKFGPGSYKRDDGKWIKAPDWQAPDLISILKKQGLKCLRRFN